MRLVSNPFRAGQLSSYPGGVDMGGFNLLVSNPFRAGQLSSWFLTKVAHIGIFQFQTPSERGSFPHALNPADVLHARAVFQTPSERGSFPHFSIIGGALLLVSCFKPLQSGAAFLITRSCCSWS